VILAFGFIAYEDTVRKNVNEKGKVTTQFPSENQETIKGAHNTTPF